MAASVNKVIILGRVGNDPEIKSTKNGNMVANLSVATDRYGKNANGEKDDKTDWHRCVFWNRQAEIVQQYVKKGSLIYLEGRIETRDWTDSEGNKRYITEIIADRLQLLPSSKDPNPPMISGSEEPIDIRSGTPFETPKFKPEPEAPVKPVKDPDEILASLGEDDDSVPF